MEWRIVYLILSIVSLIFGIWNLAQRKTFILALIGILWFFIILFQFFVKEIYSLHLLQGLNLGPLLTYIGLPSLFIFGFISSRFTR
ncbi:MAG: hypothetical protein JXJ04_22480 [Spirochaetales bacterium]|nr:hypothetical protein [Spirochaetales bacterium]